MIPLRLYHVLTTLILRPHYDYHDPFTLTTSSLRPYHDLSDCNTIYPIVTRYYHASTTIIARSYNDNTTIIPRSYRDLTTLPAITSTSCSIEKLNYSLDISQQDVDFLENNAVMQPKSTEG